MDTVFPWLRFGSSRAHEGGRRISAKNRISVSFSDDAVSLLERLSGETQKSKAELIRIMVEEHLRDGPNRFGRKQTIGLRERRASL